MIDGWLVLAEPPTPAVGIDLGASGRVVIRCDNDPGYHSYVLAISASAVAAGDWVKAKVASKTVHFTVTSDRDNGSTWLATSMTTRYPDNMSEAYDAIDAMRRANASFEIRSDTFRMTVPWQGLRDAMASMVATCGDPAELSRQVKARAEP